MSDDNSPDVGTDNLKAQMEFSVTPSALLSSLEHLLSSRDGRGNDKEQAAVMVWGAMGIGKTDVVRSVGKLWGMRIVALHLPQFDPTDLKGIPVKMDGDKVVWVPSSYLPQFKTVEFHTFKDQPWSETIEYDWPTAEQVMVHVSNGDKVVGRFNDQMNGDTNELNLRVDITKGSVTISGQGKVDLTITVIDKAVIFLDELSAAVPEVQNAALQLVLDRRVGEYDVPPFTPMVAAGNRESDGAFVSPMSAPLANRFVHLRLVPSLDDWMEWAMINRVNPEILGYLQWKKSGRLFKWNQDAMTDGDYGFPTPRSWAKLSDQMVGIHNLPIGVQDSIITGFIGKSVGHEFIQYRKVCELLPSTDDILQGKDVEISDSLDVGAKYGLATALCYAIKDYYGKYYDDSIQDIEKQSEQWRTATKAFCAFIDKHLGREMTVLCVHIVSKHLGISFTTFRGSEFQGFAKKYQGILRKTV